MREEDIDISISLQNQFNITDLQLLLLHILAIYTMQDHGICKQGSIDYRL